MVTPPRIALIHATSVAIGPIAQAFKADWPEAETFNILDDGLSADRAKDAELSPALHARIIELGRYAQSTGVAGILYTCSAFGAAIEAAASQIDLPVLKPNEAMFEAALKAGVRCGMVATFGASIPSMEQEFQAEAQRMGKTATLTCGLAEAGMTALRAGDVETHNRLVTEKAAELTDVESIMLAQFSTANAYQAVAASVNIPVLTSPGAAVAKMKFLVLSGLEKA